MSFANSSYTDILSTSIESRSGQLADNVTNNNAGLAYIKKKGNVRTFSGGSLILEEISFAENGNGSWYAGSDLLSVAAQDVISAAQYSIKQLAVPVVINGLETLQNSGEEAIIDLMSGRLKVAEATMNNLISAGFYSDGTGYGGKQLTGLGAGVVALPTTGTYGGIDAGTWTFWRNQYTGSLGAPSATTIIGFMDTLWAKCVRGKDKPDLILADNTSWSAYLSACQSLQRFTSPGTADLGFGAIKYQTADVVLDGGIGGNEGAGVMHFLNTDYLHYRPHKKRNMVPLSPDRRVSVNQDAEVAILAWAGNMTCSGRKFQGYMQNS